MVVRRAQVGPIELPVERRQRSFRLMRNEGDDAGLDATIRPRLWSAGASAHSRLSGSTRSLHATLTIGE
jgi:hypothetical protein